MDDQTAALAADLARIPEVRPYAETIAAVAAELRPDGPRAFAFLIAAIGHRETQWGRVSGKDATTGPGIVGEDGHGRGLMQIDDRFHRLALWADPAVNIRAGAGILDQCIRTFATNLQAGLAAYNCGPERVRQSLSETGNPDAHTTGRDYGAAVLATYKRWSGTP